MYFLIHLFILTKFIFAATTVKDQSSEIMFQSLEILKKGMVEARNKKINFPNWNKTEELNTCYDLPIFFCDLAISIFSDFNSYADTVKVMLDNYDNMTTEKIKEKHKEIKAIFFLLFFSSNSASIFLDYGSYTDTIVKMLDTYDNMTTEEIQKKHEQIKSVFLQSDYIQVYKKWQNLFNHDQCNNPPCSHPINENNFDILRMMEKFISGVIQLWDSVLLNIRSIDKILSESETISEKNVEKIFKLLNLTREIRIMDYNYRFGLNNIVIKLFEYWSNLYSENWIKHDIIIQSIKK